MYARFISVNAGSLTVKIWVDGRVADGAGRDFPGLFQISPGKVDPIYYGKAYKVKLILVAKFIASAHCGLKIA